MAYQTRAYHRQAELGKVRCTAAVASEAYQARVMRHTRQKQVGKVRCTTAAMAAAMHTQLV